MGLLTSIIAKGVVTAARNSTIKAVGDATVGVIGATAKRNSEKEDFVVKNGTLFINPTRSSNDYLEQKVLDITQELLGAGFENITLKPLNKLGEWSRKKYGNINSISINGKDQFLGVKKVPSTAFIVIEYLDFKKDVSPEVYSNITRIVPGIVHKAADVEAMFLNNNTGAISNVIPNVSPSVATNDSNDEVASKNFCSHCGHPVSNKEAKFCSNCGIKF